MSPTRFIPGVLVSCCVALAGCGPEEAPATAADAPALCSMCNADQVCLGGRCFDEPDCGCRFGEYCDEEAGRVCVTGCRDADDCGLGAICDDGVCAAGCATSSQCAVGAACRDGRCARGCALTDECGFGEGCVNGFCEPVECRNDADCDEGAMCADFACVDVGPATCADDEGCGYLWRCSAEGTCARCVEDADCSAHLVCVDAECVPGEMPAVSFEPIDLGRLHEHFQSYLGPDDVGYGAGAALLDFDGDGDLDIALGKHAQSDPSVCVYENRSTPGAYRFEPVAAVCDLELPGRGVVGADFDRDGVDELILLDERSVALVRFGDAPIVETLYGPEDAAATGLDCAAGVALPFDIDLDGDLDLYVGCQTEFFADPSDVSMRRNIGFEQRDDGSFARIAWPEDHPLVGAGVTLAIGVVDLDDDGLLDLILANDSYSTVGRRNTDLGPGIRLRRCAPDSSCEWASSTFTRGEDSWGSFMGVGYLLIDDAYYVYVSDWGPNRMMAASVGATDDVAAVFGLELARREGYNMFGWSVVVDDYDRDGRDDLLISHGMVPDPTVPRAQFVHANALALQAAPGRFVSWTDGTGMLQPADRRSTTDALPASSRAVLRSDLDGDGTLDLLMTTYAGYPEAYTEITAQEVPQRCTLRPRTRIVHTHGYGFGTRSAPDDAWRFYDIQGHIRSGSAASIVTTMPQGQVRFPSGAIVSFDCTTGPLAFDLEEPEWVRRTSSEDVPRFDIDPFWLDGDAVTAIAAVERTPNGVTAREVARDPATDEFLVLGASPDAAIMLRINNRWVPRWFVPR